MNEESDWYKAADDKWYLLAAISRKQKLTDKDVKRIAWKQSTYERYIIALDLLESEGAIRIDRDSGEYLETDKTFEKCSFYLSEKLSYSRQSFFIKAQGWLIYITAFALIPSTIIQGWQLSINMQDSGKADSTAKQVESLTTKTIPLLEQSVYQLHQMQDTLIKKQSTLEKQIKHQSNLKVISEPTLLH